MRRQSGESPTVDQYLSRFPQDRDAVSKAFESTGHLTGAQSTFSPARSFEEKTHEGNEGGAASAPLTAFSGVRRYCKVCKLTLAWLGRAEEAKESLEKYLATDAVASCKSYVPIQVPAWLGEFDEATAQVKALQAEGWCPVAIAVDSSGSARSPQPAPSSSTAL